MRVYSPRCQGRLFQEGKLAGVSQEELRALFESAVATMAKLHDLNWKGVGLECLADSEDYLRKRVSLRMLNLAACKGVGRNWKVSEFLSHL